MYPPISNLVSHTVGLTPTVPTLHTKQYVMTETVIVIKGSTFTLPSLCYSRPTESSSYLRLRDTYQTLALW